MECKSVQIWIECTKWIASSDILPEVAYTGSCAEYPLYPVWYRRGNGSRSHWWYSNWIWRFRIWTRENLILRGLRIWERKWGLRRQPEAWISLSNRCMMCVVCQVRWLYLHTGCSVWSRQSLARLYVMCHFRRWKNMYGTVFPEPPIRETCGVYHFKMTF
jgi:hypothetical protein